MSSSSAPPAPNYQPIADATSAEAQTQYQLGEDQLNWAKQQYANDSALTGQVVNAAINTQNQNDAAAAADRQRYQDIYQPLEDQAVQDAETYASPAKRDLEMGRAQTTVAQQFDAQRQNATRDLESYGIDPSSTRFAALDIGARTQQAAAEASAGNQAGQYVDATARALRSDAINVGRGYPGQVAGEYNTGLQGGNQAVSSNLATTASGANTMGTAQGWDTLGNSSYGSSVNAMNTGFNNSLASFQANQASSSGLGMLLGAAAGIGSKAFLGGTKPWSFAASGGEIEQPGTTPGGAVPTGASPTQGRAIDDVPARLTVGEFVIPRDVVQAKGTEFFHGLITKTRTGAQKAAHHSGAIPTQHQAVPAAPTFQSRPQALPV